MPSDRLKELQRQRALAQEQVAWLDREIARESSLLAAAPTIPVVPAAARGFERPAAPSPLDAERIIEQYQARPGSLHGEVKRGCFLYFGAAFGLLALGVLALWLLVRR
jgi:hypothetical protein